MAPHRKFYDADAIRSHRIIASCHHTIVPFEEPFSLYIPGPFLSVMLMMSVVSNSSLELVSRMVSEHDETVRVVVQSESYGPLRYES